MKTTTLLLIACAMYCTSIAQNQIHDESHHNVNSPENPCISEEQYSLLKNEIQENILLYKIEKKNFNTDKSIVTPLSWPVQASADLHDYSFYRVSAYVDHNPAVGSFQDFNCGTKTYDGHKGTDIATWPFNFYKMDNNLVEVIAAAPGTIIAKHDGEFDRNCSGNQLTANYVIIQHADGSTALYWHMKSGFVTTKAIGEAVITGEKLGIVGSSGSSSGPHLHFEIWSGADNTTSLDPFVGTCNTFNATSWWANQKPHKETAVVKATVHSTDAVFPACPTTETPNESTAYTSPFQGVGLPAGYAKFYIFIRDEVNGLVADCKILNPDNSTFSSWIYTSTGDNVTKTNAWSKVLPTITGTYTFQCTYNGITCSSTFTVGDVPTGGINENEIAQVKIYPNPNNGKFILEKQTTNGQKIEIFNTFGEKVYQTEIANQRTEINLDLNAGIYFYKLKEDNHFISSGKIIIQ
jgi:murein DD-endopeptidase MepM/ murein hydrolase activator NlpD